MTATRKSARTPKFATPVPTPPDGKATVPQAGVPEQSLPRVLAQSEQIKDVVKECADDLSAVNSALNEELRERPLRPALKTALKQSEGVEGKVQECADNLTTVNRALEAEIGAREVLEQQLVAAEAARHAALHDPLTSLPNRALFDERLKHGLAQAKRHGWTIAVMFIDLDEFKSVNDTYGHMAGDSVLQTIANRLKGMKRDDDMVSRHGGDEFLFLLLDLKSEADATMIAKKVIRTLGEPCTVTVNDAEISLDIAPSIGIAIFPGDGKTAKALIRHADKAMYRAKRERSGYAFDR